jgi:hypothetical protein
MLTWGSVGVPVVDELSLKFEWVSECSVIGLSEVDECEGKIGYNLNGEWIV